MLEVFAGRGRGKLRHYDQVRGFFVRSNALAQPLLEHLNINLLSLKRFNKGNHLFVAGNLAHNHGTEAHIGVTVDDAFQFWRVDVEARTDDQFFGASDDENGTVFFDACQVTGVEPAIFVDNCRRGFGIIIVAQHDAGAVNPKLADLSFWNVIAVCRIDEAGLYAGNCVANGPILPRFVVWRYGYGRRGFR